VTTRELTGVAIKVFAIYILVQAIAGLPLLANALVFNALDGITSNNETLYWLLGGASFIALLILAVLMWNLANRVVRQTSDQLPKDESFGITESFLISLLGVYLTVEGIQGFAYATTSTLVIMQENREFAVQNIAYLVGNFLQIIIGLSLMLKASGWANFLRWLRTAGLKGKM